MNAPLVMIGEAPGQQEERRLEPFVGPAGYRVGKWWSKVGLARHQFRIDNVYQFRPPHNKIAAVSRAELEPWMDDLHDRIALLENPQIIVPTGNTALYALTGKGKVPWHQRDGREVRAGILDWRGSILEYVDRRGRRIKVIPTPHPAATFRMPSLERACLKDWARVRAELDAPGLRLPEREHFISPTMSDVAHWVEECRKAGDQGVLGVDIERPAIKVAKKRTYIGAPVVCVGYSLDPSFSMTIPTTETYWGSPERVAEVWAHIRTINALPVQKTLHNGLYDQYHLLDYEAPLVNWFWDTLYMHHALDPSDSHDLAYCASCDTREPFWKHEAKDPDQAAKYTSNWAAFLVYNGKDVCVGRELQPVYRERLEQEVRERQGEPLDGLTFYFEHYLDLFEPLMRISRHGFRLDQPLRKKRHAQMMAECIAIQDQLKALTGLELYGKKSLSSKKIQHYLYDVLRLPRQFAKRSNGEKTESSDELTVRKLMVRFPGKFDAEGKLILQHRRVYQLSTFYRAERVDPDGRFRSSYGMNTEAGRLNSSKNPHGTGSNAQNIDREARDIFLCDEGHVGVEVDLSQAEARIDYLLIYMLTKNADLLEKARLRPDEYDQHRENAARIFGIDQVAVTKEQRYLGKKAVHAAFRDMQGLKLSGELLKDGYTFDPGECQKMIDQFKRGVPGIDDLFRWVRKRLLTDKYLQNTWGRRLYFTHDRMDDEAFRRGYSFDPQSEVADLMTQWGVKPLAAYLTPNMGAMNAEVHDSVYLSLKPECAWDVTSRLVEWLERPRLYYGIELKMPCEIKCGTNWKGKIDFKRLPNRQTFEEAAHACIAA